MGTALGSHSETTIANQPSEASFVSQEYLCLGQQGGPCGSLETPQSAEGRDQTIIDDYLSDAGFVLF